MLQRDLKPTEKNQLSLKLVNTTKLFFSVNIIKTFPTYLGKTHFKKIKLIYNNNH